MASIKLLKQIICKNADELKAFLYNFMCENYGEESTCLGGGCVYAVGDDPYTLVAHMDTVFKTTCTMESIETKKSNEDIVITSSLGIGGDDRCGVGIICELINSGLRPTIVFTENEEIGCEGALKSLKDRDLVNAIKKTNFIVELDRKGNNDAVFYRCENQKFKDFISKYGWKEKYGSYSDISVYGPACNKAAVNLSSAYYNEHTFEEYINLNEYKTIIKRVKKMLLSREAKESSFEYLGKFVRK